MTLCAVLLALVMALPAPVVGGRATWYRADGMVGAAGPALRHYLGRHWRGTLVSLQAGEKVIVVKLTDWCACPRGFVDLSDDAFMQLAPLSVGVIGVTLVRHVRVPKPPATDTED